VRKKIPVFKIRSADAVWHDGLWPGDPFCHLGLRSEEGRCTVFFAWSTWRSSRELRLSRDLLCAAEDERYNRLDRFEGCDIRGLACSVQIIGFPITFLGQRVAVTL